MSRSVDERADKEFVRCKPGRNPRNRGGVGESHYEEEIYKGIITRNSKSLKKNLGGLIDKNLKNSVMRGRKNDMMK